MLENTCVITFANTEVHRQYQLEFNKLYGNRFGSFIAYNEDSIYQSEFYQQNREMFNFKKYFGYFLWKPYLIQRTIDMVPQQYVLYCDANLRFTNFEAFENDFRRLTSKQGMYLIQHQNFINRDWTKRDTFVVMQADEERYWSAKQYWTPLVGFSKDTISRQVLREYLYYCRIPEVVTELPNTHGKENLPGFREHRWEQSVLSILVEKYGLTGTPDTTSINWVTKLYSDALMKFKENMNAQPLAKSV